MAIENRAEWDALPEVYVRLQKDELGYPPKNWEQLRGEELEEGIFRLKSIPFYARGLAWEDEVKTHTSPEGYSPVVAKVVRRSGYSTMRLSLKPTEDRKELVRYFTDRGVFLEFLDNLVALAIPRAAFDEVSDYVCDEKDKGRWDAEDGYLVIDEVALQ